jgi:predicted transcriptional regulator of viral defense system
MSPQKTQALMDAFKEATLLPSKKLEDTGFYRVELQAAVRDGLLKRVSPGLYRLAEAEVTENHSLVEASERIPLGVVCLLSALRFHQLTTQSPHEVWMAVPRGKWRPQGKGLRVFQFAAASMKVGIEEHSIEGSRVRVTTPARTVADCFKFRNKIGLDVAIEALRDARRSKKCSIDEIMRQARVCRVEKVIRPYLEALT